MKTSA